MKKFLALLCALALVACLAAPVFAEAVDLTNPVDIELMAYYVMDIPDDDVIMNYLEEKFNVNFDLKVTNIDNYAETLNMRIASDDMPDWFRVTNNNLYVQLIEDEMLLNVSEYTEKYAFENISNTLNGTGTSVLAYDGQFFCVPDTIGKLNPGVYYRADWLDELGIAEPTTPEEFKAALEQVVAADPDGMGTCGFTFYDFGQVETFFLPSYTNYNTWGMKDGSLIWRYEDENYKTFIKYFADLYANKLIDQEVFINSYETCMEKLASGRAGFYIMNLNTTWWSNNKAGLAQFDPEAYLGAMNSGIDVNGQKHVCFTPGFSASSSFDVNVSEETASRMLAVMDYLLSDEGRDLTLYGLEEGVYYDLVDGKKIQKEEAVNQDWGQTLHFMGEIADFGSNDRLAIDDVLITWNENLGNPDFVRSNYTSYLSDEKATKILAELSEIRTTYRTAWLTGEMDIDATWDEFQGKLKDAGIDEYRTILAQYVADNNIAIDPAF